MPLNLQKIIQPQITQYPLDADFLSDKVDISSFDCYKNATQKVQTGWKKRNGTQNHNIWDFSTIENKYIRIECKFFIQEKIKNGMSLSSITDYRKSFKHFTEYINMHCQHFVTVTDIVVDDYYSFLFKRNIKKNIKSYQRLLKDMTVTDTYVINPTYSIINRIQDFIYDYMEKDIPELEKDVWCIKKLPFEVNANECSQVKHLNFRNIKQTHIRSIVKQYSELRLHSKSLSTVSCDLQVFTTFFYFLYDSFFEIQHLSELNRNVIERYIAYMRTNARSENYIADQLGILNTFFNTLLLMDITDKPPCSLVLKTDYKQINNQDVKYFTNNEMKQIFAHISELDEQIARMLYVHANLGMRISELCMLRPECLTINEKGVHYIRIYQNKTYSDNANPIQEMCYKVLMKAYEVSCEKYGKETTFIFAQSKTTPIQPRTYNNALNWMSYQNKLTFDDGTPLHINSHTFRATLATKLANLGFDLDIVNRILGHTSAKSIQSYVKATEETQLKYMEKTIARQQLLISNIGKFDEIDISLSKSESMVVLDNGYCSKSGAICESANACLSCSMFVPTKEHLIKYKIQLQSVEETIAICKQNNFKKELEYNNEQKRLLERIIKELEEK